MAIKLATEKEEKEFLKTIRERAQKRRKPFSIMFELTYRCNFKCLHCYISGSHEEKKELSTKQIFSILDELNEMEVFIIGFTGGEPLIREDIFEILDYASKSGFKYVLLTNGYLIDEKVAKKIKKVNVDKVDITFNAMDPEIFDGITQVKGSFKRVKKAIEILKEKGIQVEIKSTCMRINKDEIIKASKFARSLDILYRIDGEILPCRDSCTTWVDKYSISVEEYENLRRKVHREMFEGNRPEAKTPRRRDRMFNCGVGQTAFSINPYGRMNFCLEIDYPRCNILSKSAKNCWEKIKKEVDKLNNIEDFVCKDCDLFDYCAWCPGRSYLETGSFNNCSDFFKKRVLERKELKEVGYRSQSTGSKLEA